MAYTYRTEPHPTCNGKLLAIAPKPESWRCLTDTERAFYAIGGTHWRGHQEPGSVAYTLSKAQARDLDAILRAGFHSSCQPYSNGVTDAEGRTFWHPDYPAECGPSLGLRDFTRAEALEIAGVTHRCTRTAEMNFDAPTGEIEPAPPTCDTPAEPAAYSIAPARYAKGKVAIRCPSSTGYKTRAAYLIAYGLNCRYSGRDGAYIASPAQAERFKRLYAAGFDACGITGELDCRDLGLDRLDWRAADKVARWIEAQPNAWAILEMLRNGETVADIGQLEREAMPALAALEKAGWLFSFKAHWRSVGPRKMHWQRVGAATPASAPQEPQESKSDLTPTQDSAEPVEAPSGAPSGSASGSGQKNDIAGLDEQGDCMAAFIETLETLPAVSTAPPTVAKRTPAHERAIRRAWAERRERLLMKAALNAANVKYLECDRWREVAFKRARELETAMLNSCNSVRDLGGQVMRQRTEIEDLHAKRRRSTLLARQRGKNMIAVYDVARARLDDLQADLARARQVPTYFDDTGMERRDVAAVAFDQGRHALEKSEGLERTVEGAKAVAVRQERAIHHLADELEAMTTRAIKAERALAAVTARRDGWPPAVRDVSVNFAMAS